MDNNQRLEVLCQIIRDYGLMAHMEENRDSFGRKLSLEDWQVGHDIALIDTLVNDTPLYPVNYHLAQKRARQRLGLDSEE